MDLLEVLFILLFILFPIMEGVLKKRRKSQRPPDRREGEEDGGEPDWARAEPAEPRSASDMVPDDLWEIMTGEKRERAETREAEQEPWSMEPEEAPQPVATAEPEDWRSQPWVVDDEAERRPPESLEYEGPEAYSLETPAPPPESLERPLPSPRVRHRRFHELIDRPEPRRIRRASPLVRSLRSPEGLRQAVLLKEILGPPKGLS